MPVKIEQKKARGPHWSDTGPSQSCDTGLSESCNAGLLLQFFVVMRQNRGNYTLPQQNQRQKNTYRQIHKEIYMNIWVYTYVFRNAA